MGLGQILSKGRFSASRFCVPEQGHVFVTPKLVVVVENFVQHLAEFALSLDVVIPFCVLEGKTSVNYFWVFDSGMLQLGRGGGNP
jgi:hypothetical protein